MDVPSSRDVTQWLQAWREGDQRALEQLTPLVYKELHRLAHRYMAREGPGHPLQTTAQIMTRINALAPKNEENVRSTLECGGSTPPWNNVQEEDEGQSQRRRRAAALQGAFGTIAPGGAR